VTETDARFWAAGAVLKRLIVSTTLIVVFGTVAVDAILLTVFVAEALRWIIR
jgi:hypothetical protein